jgi:hypothetical protein
MLSNDAVFQGCTSVCALAMHHTDVATFVPKSYQVFSHDPDCLRHILEFLGKTDWLPEVAHVFAHRGARVCAGDFKIGLRFFSLGVACKPQWICFA